ncbi:hypothetical protein [Nostoc punctiforme]|uniref:hypothetical protein n=1 Tax=Nostoc punctiforme TaxID=272131 RepID=UPI0002DB7608|nr:hypothetical protein [Nostoc punctiforme]
MAFLTPLRSPESVTSNLGYYLLIRSQNCKTVLTYSHEERSDRLILASVQQIMLGHLHENRFVHN